MSITTTPDEYNIVRTSQFKNYISSKVMEIKIGKFCFGVQLWQDGSKMYAKVYERVRMHPEK